MAEIYLARASGIEGFEKHVVLKRILPQYARNMDFVKMFLNEARIAATLDHPNIASVYDIDQTEAGYFFTMEYLHGEDLGFLLRELNERELRLPLELALTIMAGVAAGLHAAHDKKGVDGKPLGIVHRDVSPSNVVVTYGGAVKLVDFGIAKATAASELTGTGLLKGKIAYMSPEQCRNLPLDRRSDIFALGVLLYEMTTQTRLFRGDSEASTLQMLLECEIPPPSVRSPGFPPALEAVVLKALKRQPDQRFATARELELALENCARSLGLGLSSGGLGEWMEKTFGPKVEPWRLSESAPQSTHDAATKMMSSNEVSRALGGASPNAVTMVATPVRAVGRAAAQSQVRTWRKFFLPALALVTALVVAGGGAYVMSSRTTSGPPPSAVQLVPEKGQVSLETPGATTTALAPLPSAPRAAEEPADPIAPLPATRAKPRATPRLGTEPPRGQKFSAAFARKEKDLARCFAEAPDDAAGAGQIFVRFQADRDGRVETAEVLPEAVAQSKLGTCVARVAATTDFGPQPAPVAFRIPVSVRRLAATGKP